MTFFGPMLEPMFEPSPEAVALQVLVNGFGVALMITGLIWVHRIVTIETDSHWFRATAPPQNDFRAASLTLGVGILVTLALALISMGLVR